MTTARKPNTARERAALWRGATMERVNTESDLGNVERDGDVKSKKSLRKERKLGRKAGEEGRGSSSRRAIVDP
jgi:hypothetical protein